MSISDADGRSRAARAAPSDQPAALGPAGPLVIGHRGAPRVAPENTVESLRAALGEGADGVEFDVQRSADGELVVFHDDDLQRLTGQNGTVAQHSWRSLRRMRVHGAGREAPIAHLDEVIEYLDGRALLVNAELKCAALVGVCDDDRRLADALAGRLAMVDTTPWLVSGFNARAMRHFAAHGVPVRLGALLEETPTGWEGLLPADAEAPVKATEAGLALHSVHPPQHRADGRRVGAWKNAGLAVVPWTVNAEADWDRLARLDVAAMITDHPGGLRAFLERHGLRRSESASSQ